MKQVSRLNQTMLKSMPIRSSVKHYVMLKYSYLWHHNGGNAAADMIKNLYQSVAVFVSADDTSVDFAKAVLKEHGLKPRKGLIELLELAKPRPHDVLDFLKFPDTDQGIHVSRMKPYEDLRKELSDQPLDSGEQAMKGNFSFMGRYSNLFEAFIKKLMNSAYAQFIGGNSKSLSGAVRRNPSLVYLTTPTISEQRRFTNGASIMVDLWPTPWMYKDGTKVDGVWHSSSYEKDQQNWRTLKGHYVREMNVPNNDVVGSINLVPKAGQTDWRAVASPNRYFQYITAPLYRFLTSRVHKVQIDATFDQHRFDKVIQSWVDNPELEPMSVDLHHATNYLPFSVAGAWWYAFSSTVNQLIEKGKFQTYKYNINLIGIAGQETTFDSWDVLTNAWNRFVSVSKGLWETPSGNVRFNAGQPLGLLPSFRVLGLSNALLADFATEICRERRELPLDDLFSPQQEFCILGDDVVFKHRIIAEVYMDIMKELNVPISYNKCFSGNLVEYAGQTFVKNQGLRPRYTTDMHWLSWGNLFDYTRSTGIRLDWLQIPKPMRLRFAKTCLSVLGDVVDLSTTSHQDIHRIFGINLCQRTFNSLSDVLSGRTNVSDYTKKFKMSFTATLDEIAMDKIQCNWTEEPTDAYLYMNSKGEVFTDNTPYSDIKRFNPWLTLTINHRQPRRLSKPQWKKVKYRLVSTDQLVNAAAIAAIKVAYHRE